MSNPKLFRALSIVSVSLIPIAGAVLLHWNITFLLMSYWLIFLITTVFHLVNLHFFWQAEGNFYQGYLALSENGALKIFGPLAVFSTLTFLSVFGYMMEITARSINPSALLFLIWNAKWLILQLLMVQLLTTWFFRQNPSQINTVPKDNYVGALFAKIFIQLVLLFTGITIIYFSSNLFVAVIVIVVTNLLNDYLFTVSNSTSFLTNRNRSWQNSEVVSQNRQLDRR